MNAYQKVIAELQQEFERHVTIQKERKRLEEIEACMKAAEKAFKENDYQSVICHLERIPKSILTKSSQKRIEIARMKIDLYKKQPLP